MDFKLVGKLNLSKETDKFKPYEEHIYDSGWVRKTLKMNAICGDNRHMLSIQTGAFNDGHGDVYTFSKGGQDENGNKIKGTTLKIPFNERFTSNKLQEVAEFKKFVFDLEKPGRRQKIKDAIDKVKEGRSLTDDELSEIGISEETELNEEYEKSLKRKHSYISEWDFVDFIKKVIDSGKYKDSKFFITGSVEYNYSEKDNKFYENYIPRRISLTDNDREEFSTASLVILYDENSLDTLSVDEKHRYYVNGWTMNYENNIKKSVPVPITISIEVPENDEDKKSVALAEGIKRKFVISDGSIKELGIEVQMINGAQKTEIDIDSLPDEVKEDIEYGIVTLDEIRKEIGNVYGDRIREYKFSGISNGYKSTGRKDTVYTSDDMLVSNYIEDDVDNLFGDDDEDI